LSCDSCLGQLDLLYSSLSPESNPVSDPFFAALRLFCIRNLALSATRLTLFRSSVGVKSGFPIPAAFLGLIHFRDSGFEATCPTLPGWRSQSSDCFAHLAPTAPRGPRSCRRVPERAGPRVTWFGVGWPSGRPLRRGLPLAASRTPQGSENVTRASLRSQILPDVTVVTSG
jgi:hypothetical protein